MGESNMPQGYRNTNLSKRCKGTTVRSNLISIAFLCVSGCHQADTASNASKDLEQKIYKFYAEAPINQSLQINVVPQSKSINAFCVLSAYEDRVSGEGYAKEKVNKELEQIKLTGSEEYWHLIVITDNKVVIAHFATTELPLISPRPIFDGNNCKTTTSIKLIKQAPPFHASTNLGRLRKPKPVINIQGGNPHGHNDYR